MIRFNFTIFWTLGAAANKRVFEGSQLKCGGARTISERCKISLWFWIKYPQIQSSYSNFSCTFFCKCFQFSVFSWMPLLQVSHFENRNRKHIFWNLKSEIWFPLSKFLQQICHFILFSWNHLIKKAKLLKVT